jgi:DNA polymerase-4
MRLGSDVSGLFLPFSVGVAANKMVSNIASRLDFKETVRDVASGGEASFMAPLRTDVIPGIGDVRRRILLEELNIRRVGELAALDMGSLGMVFGRQAPVIRQRALGIDPTPVYPVSEKPLVSEEIVLEKDENDDDLLLGALTGLVERCAFRLRQLRSRPRKAGLLVRYSDRMEAKRKISLGCGGDLQGLLKGLFFSACSRRVRVRFMQVWFWDFVSDMVQLSLFDERTLFDERRLATVKAVDRIRERYGEALIGYGNQRIHTSQCPLPLLQGLGDGRN